MEAASRAPREPLAEAGSDELSAPKSSPRAAPSASRPEPLLPLGDGPDSDIAPLLLDEPLLPVAPPAAPVAAAASASKPVEDDLLPLLEELPLLGDALDPPASPAEARKADAAAPVADAKPADDLKLPDLDLPDDLEELLPASALAAEEPVIAPSPPAEARAPEIKPPESAVPELKTPELPPVETKAPELTVETPKAEKPKPVAAVKAASPKPTQSQTKAAEPAKAGEARAPEAKARAPRVLAPIAREAKTPESKTPDAVKAAEAKAPDAKAAEPKLAELAKAADAKPAEPKALESKTAEPKALDLEPLRESPFPDEHFGSSSESAPMPPFPPLSLIESPPVAATAAAQPEAASAGPQSTTSQSPVATTAHAAPAVAPTSSASPTTAKAPKPASPAKSGAAPKAAKPAKPAAPISVSTMPASPAPAAAPASATPAAPANSAAAAFVSAVAASGAQAPAGPVSVPTPAMDRDFILRNQIVERYISGKLPIKGATDFEKFCADHPELLDELGLPERVNAGLRILEAAGKPEPWQEAPKRFWEKPQIPLGLAALSIVLLVGLAATWNGNVTKDARIAKLEKHVAEQPLDAATTTRTIRLLPSFKGSSNSPAVTIGGGSAQLADLKLDLSRSAYRSFRITIDRIDQGRVGVLQNVGKDSNGHIRIALNTSALGPGNYQFTMEGITWKGETVPEAWITIGLVH